MNAPFEWAPLFTGEKINERKNECKSGETEIFFSQIFFVLKMKAMI